jgi:hypothetical protein
VHGIVRWIRSTLGGEVSIADLDARRGAGTAAYSLLDEANAAEGNDRSTRLFRLCAWNAFALQTIADTLIAADAAADPATAGYVPRPTLSYASACLDAVPEWIRQARIVISDPAARIAADLPARLPRWQHDEPTKHIELLGLRAAYEALQPRVESDLEAFCAGASLDRAREVTHLRRVCAEMASNADYANALDLRSAGPVDRGEVRWRLLDALQHAFELGQLLALPTLAEIVQVREDRDAGLPISSDASWLQIGPAWPVLDRSGVNLGLVQRVRGNRQTGEFEGIDIDTSLSSATLHIPPEAIAAIGAGQIRLSANRAELEGMSPAP